ncbi:hypothetical protein ACM66B_006678 [Microbotryomycetes sp. NB124-2]
MLGTSDLVVALAGIVMSLWLRQRDTAARYPRLVVKQILVYPIKSLPPISVERAKFQIRGFEHDRTFMLVTVDGHQRTCQMVSTQPQNCLLTPQLIERNGVGYIRVTSRKDSSTFEFQLVPDTSNLDSYIVNLHKSPVEAFDLGQAAADFFERHCETGTRLVYVGPSRVRKTIGSISQGRDKASYMVATTASLEALSSLINRDMPMVPLRPNIVLHDPSYKLQPWVEDFWSRLTFTTKSDSESREGQGRVEMRLTANCVRCMSLNIDYERGVHGKGGLQPLA